MRQEALRSAGVRSARLHEVPFGLDEPALFLRVHHVREGAIAMAWEAVREEGEEIPHRRRIT